MRIAAAIAIACLAPVVCAAQDLTPRAYVVVPVESNAVNVTYAFADGELLFDPTVPIEDAASQLAFDNERRVMEQARALLSQG